MEQLLETKRRQSLNAGIWPVAAQKWASKRFLRRYRRKVSLSVTNALKVTYRANRTEVVVVTLSQMEFGIATRELPLNLLILKREGRL